MLIAVVDDFRRVFALGKVWLELIYLSQVFLVSIESRSYVHKCSKFQLK